MLEDTNWIDAALLIYDMLTFPKTLFSVFLQQSEYFIRALLQKCKCLQHWWVKMQTKGSVCQLKVQLVKISLTDYSTVSNLHTYLRCVHFILLHQGIRRHYCCYLKVQELLKRLQLDRVHVLKKTRGSASGSFDNFMA